MADNDWLTLAEARRAVGLSSNATQHDSHLAAMVTGVCEMLDERYGCEVQRAVTDTVDGGNRLAFLTTRPVASVTSVTEYDRQGTATSLTAETVSVKPADGYRAVDGGMLERRQSGSPSVFAAGEANVVAVYTAGRVAETADVPEQRKRAAGLCLRVWWETEAVQSVSEGEFQVPASRWPGFAVPNAVDEILRGLQLAGAPGAGVVVG